MKTLRAALRFLRFCDEHGRLSITNCGCWLVLTKLALVPHPGVGELGALLLSLATYQSKKLIDAAQVRAAASDVKAEHVQALDAVKDQLGDLTKKVAQQNTAKAFSPGRL